MWHFLPKFHGSKHTLGVGVHSTSRQQLTLSAVTVRRGASGENGMALAINVFEASRRAVAPDPLHNA